MAHLPELLVLKGSDTAPAHAGADVLRVLLEAGVISGEDVVDRDVVIRDRSSRNLAFEIEVQGRGASFAKLARDAEGVQRLRREAQALEALERVGLRLGPVLLARGKAGLLVIQGLPDHETPWSLSSDERCRPRIGAALGRGLGLLHRSEADLPGEDVGPPPAVALAEPDASARGGLGPGAAALGGVLGKDPSAAESLAAAAAGWLPLAPTHRDVKWDNVLVGVGPAGEVDVRLVDWESAGTGDPLWDLGSAAAEWVAAWIASVRVTDGPRRGAVDVPPESAHEPVRALHRSYIDACGPTLARRATPAGVARWAGVRLLQHAVEQAESAMELTRRAVLLAQAGLNMVRKPEWAAERYLGLADAGARSVEAVSRSA